MNGPRTALVTGAGGFIGGHLCRRLLAAGWTVRGFARSAMPELDAGSEFHGDILDREAVERACAGVGTIFHLAGIAATAGVREDAVQRVHVEGTRNRLGAAEAAGARRLIFVSSALAAELDDGPGDGRAGCYAQGKWQAERLLLEANGRNGVLTTVLRPAPVYGPGMKSGLARMIRLIEAHRLPPLPKLGGSFSLAGVDDVCQAAMLAAQSLLAPGQCWLLTDLRAYTANAIELAIREALGREKPRRRPPAVLFSAAAAILRLGGLVGSKRAQSALQSWRKLSSSRVWPADDIYEELSFRPSGSFYGQLPEIVRDLTRERP